MKKNDACSATHNRRADSHRNIRRSGKRLRREIVSGP